MASVCWRRVYLCQRRKQYAGAHRAGARRFAYLGAQDAATNNAGLLTLAVMDNLTQVFKSAGFICLAPAAPLQGVPCTNDGVAQDISGNRIPAQQDLSYNIALTKTFETGNGSVDIRLSRKYRGQSFGDIWNNERSDIPESSNGDLLVSFRPNNGEWYLNGFVKNINDSNLDELVVTDSIPLNKEANNCKVIRSLPLAPLLAETVRRISNEESISAMFL